MQTITSFHSSGLEHEQTAALIAEYLALEQARLKLRAELGRTVDRGRLVRAALDFALGDLAEHGTDSEIARRLAAS